jgi:hypothetical protein
MREASSFLVGDERKRLLFNGIIATKKPGKKVE